MSGHDCYSLLLMIDPTRLDPNDTFQKSKKRHSVHPFRKE
ncbi:hypothetical protein LEP1GSC193_3666 [Leptospira alstonii serovar Pingchang str. 80-412]|uniref:Uncharacterized protein n=2 Tax=Leptospira alstonii TaxID=28452 RepID=M6D234_9LEPT|nr:hypothetical protein LEP1GSC194_3403 [Leptospira alstonii serovar Sichuan str. 79601]EQA81210.1 hypothetical protein LEP1GSC193_3666 [Leptospira alstonii serovar Pingchang str. 80-412]